MTTRRAIALAVASLTLTAAACTSDDTDISSTTSATVPPSRSTEPTSTLPTTGGTASTTPSSATAAPDPSTPRPLDTSGAPGSDPEDGHLINFTPWGNLGFYYEAAGIGYSDQTIHLGTYDAALDQLTLLAAGDVTVSVIE